MPKIVMVAYRAMQPLDFIGPYDLFTDRFSSMGIETIVAGESRGTLQVDEHLSVRCDIGFDENAGAVDVLFVPGGSGLSDVLRDDGALRFLQSCEASWITSVCTGSLLLAAAGLLRGYRATTHWRYVDLLELGGAIPVEDERVVMDRNRLTGGGVTAGIDFGLHLLALLHGEDHARLAQIAFEYAPAPPFEGTPKRAPDYAARYRERTAERYEKRKAEFCDALKRMEAQP